MNAVILVAVVVIITMLVACWVLVVRLMAKREISNPHQIFELWQSGHAVGRLYFRLFLIALIAFAVICFAAMLRG